MMKREMKFQRKLHGMRVEIDEPKPQSILPAEDEGKTFVGRLEYTSRGGIVYIDKRLSRDNVVVDAPDMGGACEGDKVVVRILRPGSKRHLPLGEVIAVLGQAGDNNAEMHAILAEYGLPYSYPADLEQEANRIDAVITPDEIARRRDFRDVLTFTIDPADAKDFDDAISYVALPDGTYQVGVHIADVTHYVRPGSPLDEEAYRRATSVYLVDRTIPMLPEHLSNGICSLRPNEEKLCFSVVFHLNAEARILDYDICRTVICSDRRFAYEEAQEIIEAEEVSSDPLSVALHSLWQLASILREERFEHGAISFDREEVKFHLDSTGKPVGIYLKASKEANHLIEEFMLLANRTVAAHVGRGEVLESGFGMLKKYRHALPKTFVYRVHDLPDPEKLSHLSSFIARFGYNLKTNSTRRETVTKNINQMLERAVGTPEQNLIETLTVRAMAKAVYSTENIGHYGLSFPYYTHFTSPIRRYPDMMVHRLLDKYLFGDKQNADPSEYEGYCQHCSSREQLAANAERASIRYKQVEWMQDQLGQTFTGVITSVVEWGFFVEITDAKCEGLVSMRDITPQDFYYFDEKNLSLIGERTGTVYTLGDTVRVTLVRADLDRRQLDFTLA